MELVCKGGQHTQEHVRDTVQLEMSEVLVMCECRLCQIVLGKSGNQNSTGLKCVIKDRNDQHLCGVKEH